MDSKFNQKTLSLFDVVLLKDINDTAVFLYEEGVAVESGAVWAMPDIQDHLNNLSLSGNDLNKTFHKSWEKVQNSSRLELLIYQISHYISTYGSNFEDEIYIPNEVLNVPELKITLKTIKAVSNSFIIEKSLAMLQSGISLKEETINDLLYILDQLDYKFNGNEGVKNKEALILIADKLGVYPSNPEEFLRFLVWRCTKTTLLIKSKDVLEKIVFSRVSLGKEIEEYGAEKLATIFNRFKPLFLAMRKAHDDNKNVINKISKLSKTLHIPMVKNPINHATRVLLTNDDLHWLENATPYALLKALEACFNRKKGQSTFVYRIRNGKSWVRKGTHDIAVCEKNYNFILDFMKNKFNGNQKIVYIPENIIYAVPTSEKMMVGNVPTGTKFLGKSLAAGVYWKNSWGAKDIDISALEFGKGKIGWNSDYSNEENSVTYSGDITSAPNGAVEYLWAKGDFRPTLVMSNIYNGNCNCKYRIVVGEGAKVTSKYMMDPNKVMADIETSSVQKQTVVGLLMDEGDGTSSFTLLNFGAGSVAVSGNGFLATLTTTALKETLSNGFDFNHLLGELGYTIVSEKPDEDSDFFNLEMNELNKSSFLNFFN